MAPRTVLFVDDDPGALAALHRSFAVATDAWEPRFASSGSAALARLEEEKIDVLVTDMRMPGMDGGELLTKVRERFPQVVRVVLSGYADERHTLRALPVAHHYLSKPVTVERLLAVLDQAVVAHGLMDDPKLRAAVGDLDGLPPRPEVFTAVTAMLADPECDLAEVAKRIEQDMAIAVQLIKVTNTPFFYRGARVTTVLGAIQRLGLSVTRDLVLALELKRLKTDCRGYSIEQAYDHALRVAQLCQLIAAERPDAEDAFMAGLLHDVGETVAALQVPERFARALEARAARPLASAVIERAHLGATHGELGGFLLGLWGFPYPLMAAVAYHHEPWRLPHEELHLVDILAAAELLLEGCTDTGRHRQLLAYFGERGLVDTLFNDWAPLASTLDMHLAG